MEKNLIARTLTFYIVLIVLLLVDMYYIKNPLINFLNIIIIAVVSYLYMKLVNDANKFYIGGTSQ